MGAWEFWSAQNTPPKLGGVPFARFLANGGVVPEENHPVCAFQRWLRGFLFMAHPPLLTQEGSLPNCASSSLFIRRNHRPIDQIPDGMGHFMFARSFPPPPLPPALFFSGDFLFEPFALIFEGPNPWLSFPGHEVLVRIQRLITGHSILDQIRGIDFLGSQDTKRFLLRRGPVHRADRVAVQEFVKPLNGPSRRCGVDSGSPVNVFERHGQLGRQLGKLPHSGDLYFCRQFGKRHGTSLYLDWSVQPRRFGPQLDDAHAIAKLSQHAKQIHMLNKSPGFLDPLLQVFRAKLAIARRQEAGIRAFPYGNQVHVFEFSRVSIRANLAEYFPEYFLQRRTRFG